FLVTLGFQYEAPTGSPRVFQGEGDGVITVFGTAGKEFAENMHVLATVGYQFPADRPDNSSFVYTSLHLDYGIGGWLYPLAELNWFHYTHSGDHGLPGAVGEGDGILNLGTSGVAGNDLVTAAFGLKARLCDHLDTGAAYEFPITGDKNLIDGRILAEII